MTTYSSFGMVKLSRTSFGFFTLAGFAALTGFTVTFLVAVLVTDLVAAFFVAGFLAAGRLVGAARIVVGALVAARAVVVEDELAVFFAVAFT